MHPSRQIPSTLSDIAVEKAPSNALEADLTHLSRHITQALGQDSSNVDSRPMSAGASLPRQTSPKVILQQPPRQYGSALPLSTSRTTCPRPTPQSFGYRPQLPFSDARYASPAPNTAQDPYGPSNLSYESQYGANPHQSHDEYRPSPHQTQQGYSNAQYEHTVSNQGQHDQYASSAHSRGQEYGYGPPNPAVDGSRLPWSGSESWDPDQYNQTQGNMPARNYGGQSGRNSGWY